jgi:hypothetical protein
MSVFRASNSSAAWPIAADPFADGPTERLAPADPDGVPAPPAHRGVVFAMLVSMLALVVSAGSGLVAWHALGRAEEASAGPVPVPAAPVSTYADEVLRAQAGCDAVLYVDLDEPRVNVPGTAGDLGYHGRCGAGTPRLALGPGAVAGSSAGEADVGEAGCAKAIRTRPLVSEADLPVRKGLVFCVLTGPPPDSGDLAGAGVRLVRTEITEVAADGTADLRVTSWAAQR